MTTNVSSLTRYHPSTLLLAAIVAGLTGVAAGKATAATAAKDVTIALVLNDLTNPVSLPLRKGAEDAAKELGFKPKDSIEFFLGLMGKLRHPCLPWASVIYLRLFAGSSRKIFHRVRLPFFELSLSRMGLKFG